MDLLPRSSRWQEERLSGMSMGAWAALDSRDAYEAVLERGFDEARMEVKQDV